MSRRLLLTGAIPILGLVALFAGLALSTRDLADVRIEYAGNAYVGGRVVSAAEAARDDVVRTDERVDGLQVWVPRPREAAAPLVYLLRPDGRYHRYELEEG
jgi:hypothetical protein